MNSQNYEDFINSFPAASKFTEQLQTQQQQLPSVLAEFKSAYLLYNQDPNNQEYQQSFQNMKSNLNNLNSNLFTLSNDVQSNIEQINLKLFALDVLIKQERKRNKELKRKLGIVEHKKGATSEMIVNYKEMYESKYLQNWGLFLSIIFVIVTITKIYGKPKIPNLPVSNLQVPKTN